MNEIIYISILLISSTICSAVLSPDCKNHKQTTHDSFACVCTEAHPCDKIEGPIKTAAGVVTKWESSRDGARLRKSTLHFGQNSIKGMLIMFNLPCLNFAFNIWKFFQ